MSICLFSHIKISGIKNASTTTENLIKIFQKEVLKKCAASQSYLKTN